VADVNHSLTALSQGWRPRLEVPMIEQAFRNDGKLTVVANNDLASWYPYPLLQPSRPALRQELLSAQIALAALIDEILLYVLPSSDDGTAESEVWGALKTYEKLLSWKQGLPDAISSDHEDVAHVLLLQ